MGYSNLFVSVSVWLSVSVSCFLPVCVQSEGIIVISMGFKLVQADWDYIVQWRHQMLQWKASIESCNA